MTHTEETPRWSAGQLVAFRFAALFWTLTFLCPPSMLDLFGTPGAWVSKWISWPFERLTLWAGITVFRLQGESATFHSTGSGDTALSWVGLACTVVLAVAGTMLWSVLDRRRRNYRALSAWLRMLLSFQLGSTLLLYGWMKIFPAQFGSPVLYRLNETYGESSPMALLWTFMAGSKAYQLVTGVAEAVPGVLLFFRRTRTLGALIAAGVMFNIVALNFCYDVPVKMYSSLLFLLAVYLAWPDAIALVRVFVLRKPAQLSVDHVRPSQRRWLRVTGRVMQCAVLLAVIAACVMSGRSGVAVPPKEADVPLYGVWARNDEPGKDAVLPWKRIAISSKQSASAAMNDGTREQYALKVDRQNSRIMLNTESKTVAVLTYTKSADGRWLHVDGLWQGSSIVTDLHRIDPPAYALQTRGFHWVQEYAYNR